METKKVSIENNQNQLQEFEIDEYDDHIVLGTFSSNSLIVHVDIPAEINEKPVTAIGEKCFFNCKNIKEIVFPNTIITIGAQAFALCSGIEKLIIPDSVTNIDHYAFMDCRGLKKIVMPSGMKTLKGWLFAFGYLPDDFDITLKEGLETIEEGAFSSGRLALCCTLRLPESVQNIAIGAFEPGMKIITSLPYDKSWFEKWPYSQTVRINRMGKNGIIVSIKRLESGCELHEVVYESNKDIYFSPCDYADNVLTFKDPESQKRMNSIIDEFKKIDSDNSYGNMMSDLYKIRDMWRRGFV